MSLESTMKIAVILSAYDKMSSVINSATDNAQKRMKDLMNKSFVEGGLLFGAGQKIAGILQPAIDSFGEFQEAGNNLKASMMGPGGMLDEGTFNKISNMSMNLSDKYTGTASSYLDMVAVLKNNRIDENDILGGIGESTAKLADLFQMVPADIAAFSAHMKNDMGVAVGDMDKMMDTISRVHNAGVGITGYDAVTQMNEFYSKASLGAANLGIQGVEATQKLGALGAMFMSRGLSGQSVGTNFRRIFDGMGDHGKVQKAIDIAKQYHVQLQFFDKKGKFMGIDNFVAQLGKMKDLQPQQVTEILKTFGGRQGLSTDFLEYLAKYGVNGMDEFTKKMKDQATYTEKLHEIMGGLNYLIRVMKTSWTNLKAVFGATLGPSLELFYNLMNKVISAVRSFLQLHPRIARFASAVVVLTSAFLMAAGIIKIIKGIRVAFALLNIVMALNPFLIWVTIGIAAVALLYAYWDKIPEWWDNIWGFIKEIPHKALEWIKHMFFNYTPEGLIISHWSQITAWFSNLWDGIKSIFHATWEALKNIVTHPIEFIKKEWTDFFDWFQSSMVKLDEKLFHSFYWNGKSPYTNMMDKMKKEQPELINHTKKMAQAVDDYLPHSPARKGALSHLNKVRIFETIAETMKPNILANKMRLATNNMANVGYKGRSNNSPGNGLHFTLNVHLSGSATQRDAKMISNEAKKNFAILYKQHTEQINRLSFG